jgi:AraC family transcriptional regulator
MLNEITKEMGGLSIRVSTQTAAGNGSGKHAHEHTNLVFILEGGCLEKRQQNTYERKVADLAFLHAGECHETRFTDGCTRYISLDIRPETFVRYGISENGLEQAVQQTPDAKFLVLKMYRELLQNDELTGDAIQMALLELAAVSRIVSDTKRPPVWVRTVYQLLQDRWNETITLQELSLAAGVHPITISKHFPRYFACTLGSYLRKLRIERSLPLIKNSDLSLTQTAYACQFFDQSHFIRNFRACTTLTPKQFKKG